MDRPQFQQFLRDCASHRFAALICYRLDRISRSVSDFSTVLDQLQDYGVDFVSINESFDTSTPMGRAMVYIASVFAQLERETIAERVRDNKYMLAYTGRWQGGTPPQGYRTEPVEYSDQDGKRRTYYHLVQDPDWAPHILFLYQKYVELGSLAALEVYLKENRRVTVTGKEYSRAGLQALLRNPVYAKNTSVVYDYLEEKGVKLSEGRDRFDGKGGLIGYSKTQQYGKFARRRKLSQDHWIVALGDHPGIVDGRLWVRAQRIMESHRGAYSRVGTGSIGFCSGLLCCAHCGQKMLVKSGRVNAHGDRTFYYKCSRKEMSKGKECGIQNVNGPVLERCILEEIQDLLRRKGDLTPLLQKKEGAEERMTAQKRLELEIDKRERNIQKLLRSFSQSEDPELDRQLQEVLSQQSREQAECRERLRELTLPQTSGDSWEKEQIQNAIFSYLDQFDNLPLEEKRKFFRELACTLYWDGAFVKIELPKPDAKEEAR